MHNLVFCFTEHFASSYNCQNIINQCQIITFLTFKSDNVAKSRKDLKEILFQINKRYIYYHLTFHLVQLLSTFSLFQVGIEGKCEWIIGEGGGGGGRKRVC